MELVGWFMAVVCAFVIWYRDIGNEILFSHAYVLFSSLTISVNCGLRALVNIHVKCSNTAKFYD